MEKWCDDKLCVDKLCVDKWCEDKLCVDELCEDTLYEDKLCVDMLCVIKLCGDTTGWGGRREAGGGAGGIQNQKQEPHTKMWGIHTQELA